jgi:RES domain
MPVPLIPKTTYIRQDDTHRLIPSRYSDQSVLSRLAGNDKELADLFELDGATNDRLLGEANLLPGISVHELLFGIAYAHIVNAAFTHAHPAGSRFNGPDRGAWYASFELETSEDEVVFHKQHELEEINWTEPETFTFDDYLADFRAEFHDIRGDKHYAGCLDPSDHSKSQQLGKELLAAGSAGILYPSARNKGGTCIVCFRPALVANVRLGPQVSVAFTRPGAPPAIKRRRRHKGRVSFEN